MKENIDLSNEIEVDCFICGSTNIVNGKCMNCGYECEVEFVCPYHNGSMRCNKSRKMCTKDKLRYFECPIYQGSKS